MSVGWRVEVSAVRPASYCSALLTTPALRPVASVTWRELIKRVWEVDPLLYPRCGTEMVKLAAIRDPVVIIKILQHLHLWEESRCGSGIRRPAARSTNRAMTTHPPRRSQTIHPPLRRCRSSRITTTRPIPNPFTTDATQRRALGLSCRAERPPHPLSRAIFRPNKSLLLRGAA